VREVELVVIRHEGVLDHLAHLHDGPSVGFGGVGTALVPGADLAPPCLALERVFVSNNRVITGKYRRILQFLVFLLWYSLYRGKDGIIVRRLENSG